MTIPDRSKQCRVVSSHEQFDTLPRTANVGLCCRRCGDQNLKVVYTRRRHGRKVDRRRECRNCGTRVSTVERAVGG
jgi:hypothetical protein